MEKEIEKVKDIEIERTRRSESSLVPNLPNVAQISLTISLTGSFTFT